MNSLSLRNSLLRGLQLSTIIIIIRSKRNITTISATSTPALINNESLGHFRVIYIFFQSRYRMKNQVVKTLST